MTAPPSIQSPAADGRIPTEQHKPEPAVGNVPNYLAFFSTRGGRSAPRRAHRPRPSLVARSDATKDTQHMIEDLRKNYRHVCYSIFPGWDIRWFFDEYDFEFLGGQFLYNVLYTIMEQNIQNVEIMARRWSETNHRSFQEFAAIFSGDFPVERAFHKEDIDEHGIPFLQQVLRLMSTAYARATEEHAAIMAKEQIEKSISSPHPSGLNHGAFMDQGAPRRGGLSSTAVVTRVTDNFRGGHGSSGGSWRGRGRGSLMQANRVFPGPAFDSSMSFGAPIEEESRMPRFSVPFDGPHLPLPPSAAHQGYPITHPMHPVPSMVNTNQNPLGRNFSGPLAPNTFDGSVNPHRYQQHGPRPNSRLPSRELWEDPDQPQRSRKNSGSNRKNSVSRGGRGGGRGGGYGDYGSNRRSSISQTNASWKNRSSNDEKRVTSYPIRGSEGMDENSRESITSVVAKPISVYAGENLEQDRISASRRLLDGNLTDNGGSTIEQTRAQMGAPRYSPPRFTPRIDFPEFVPGSQPISVVEANAVALGRDDNISPGINEAMSNMVLEKYVGRDIEDIHTLVVTGFNYPTSKDDIAAAIGPVAAVSYVQRPNDSKVHPFQPYTFVDFYSTADVRKVLMSSPILCHGRPLFFEVPMNRQTHYADGITPRTPNRPSDSYQGQWSGPHISPTRITNGNNIGQAANRSVYGSPRYSRQDARSDIPDIVFEAFSNSQNRIAQKMPNQRSSDGSSRSPPAIVTQEQQAWTVANAADPLPAQQPSPAERAVDTGNSDDANNMSERRRMESQQAHATTLSTDESSQQPAMTTVLSNDLAEGPGLRAPAAEDQSKTEVQVKVPPLASQALMSPPPESKQIAPHAYVSDKPAVAVDVPLSTDPVGTQSPAPPSKPVTATIPPAAIMPHVPPAIPRKLSPNKALPPVVNQSTSQLNPGTAKQTEAGVVSERRISDIVGSAMVVGTHTNATASTPLQNLLLNRTILQPPPLASGVYDEKPQIQTGSKPNALEAIPESSEMSREVVPASTIVSDPASVMYSRIKPKNKKNKRTNRPGIDTVVNTKVDSGQDDTAVMHDTNNNAGEQLDSPTISTASAIETYVKPDPEDDALPRAVAFSVTSLPGSRQSPPPPATSSNLSFSTETSLTTTYSTDPSSSVIPNSRQANAASTNFASNIGVKDWRKDYQSVLDIAAQLREAAQGFAMQKNEAMAQQFEDLEKKLSISAEKSVNSSRSMKKKGSRAVKEQRQQYENLIEELHLFHSQVKNKLAQPPPKYPPLHQGTAVFNNKDGNHTASTPAAQPDSARIEYYQQKQPYNDAWNSRDRALDSDGEKSRQSTRNDTSTAQTDEAQEVVHRPHYTSIREIMGHDSSGDDSLRTFEIERKEDGMALLRKLNISTTPQGGLIIGCPDDDSNRSSSTDTLIMEDQLRSPSNADETAPNASPAGVSPEVDATAHADASAGPAPSGIGSDDEASSTTVGLGISGIQALPTSPKSQTGVDAPAPAIPTSPSSARSLLSPSDASFTFTAPTAPMSYARAAASPSTSATGPTPVLSPPSVFHANTSKPVTSPALPAVPAKAERTREGGRADSRRGPNSRKTSAAPKSRGTSSIRSGGGNAPKEGDDDWKTGPEGAWGSSGFPNERKGG